jgi:DNA-binding MarR family transcriptional regulator
MGTEAVESEGTDLCLSFLVRQAWLGMRAAIDRALAEHSLSVAQYATLLVLSEQPGLSIAEVARVESITRQSANELITGMVADGLVSRESHPSDRRRQRIFLTDQGRARLEVARPAVVARERRMEAALPPEQRQAARAWLAYMTTEALD